MSGTPLTGGRARVFLIEGRARADHTPSYEYQMRVTGPTQGYGAIERIESPDPNQYDSWVEVGETVGANERPTATLEGHYAQDILSTMLMLARKKCAFDVQLHFGACEDPRSFNVFDKIVVFEKAKASSWGTGDLGALQSGDNAVVDETLEFSAKWMYELGKMTFGKKADSLVSNLVNAVTIGDTVACGDCGDSSDGCYKIYAVTNAAGGSPSTPADIVFSIDKGINWFAHDIDAGFAITDHATGVAVVGDYVVVVSPTYLGHVWVDKDELNGVIDPAWAAVTTGYVAAKQPKAIWSYGSGAYAVGNGGYVYKIEDVTSAATVADAGVSTLANLNAVHGLSEEFAVAVGNTGVVIYTENGTTWATTTTNPVGVGVTINCVFIKSEYEWWVGCSNGSAYTTYDKGTTWSVRAFSGSGSGQVYSIVFATDTTGFLAHATAANVGRIFRTNSGGNSWYIMPDGSGTLPANDRVVSLAVCGYNDPNFVVGGGLADDGSDGYIVVGSAA